MKAIVYKIHSDFYYVKQEGKTALLECKLREILKKGSLKIKVGDFVEIDEAGAISALLERKNTLMKPKVSNLDLVVVVSSLLEPAFNLNQLDRYLTFLKYNKIPALLCFNKDDLIEKKELDNIKSEICKIYEPLGYDIVFTSALYGGGLIGFEKFIKGKTIAFCGMSGAGKSTITNFLSSKELKTGRVSAKNKRGMHTTRHCEIIEINETRIIDTPGFSKLTFDFLLPKDLSDLFDEIHAYKKECHFSNCLHTNEDEECGVIKNLDKIPKSRYESYLSFLEEAKVYKQKILHEGKKEETSFKSSHNRNFTKISGKKRSFSRKKINQNLKGQDND
ncbi:MAG: ribosome small subunit-dependent GTPase A [Candidatus Gastranaerophilales bacterium]|nr:ribosome small subunit-dependent GTPase A [Candidatus Gastranaerophilales bacterium]